MHARASNRPKLARLADLEERRYAEGAGASGRHSIGTGIMGGMIFATVLGIFFVPAFFVMVQWIGEKVTPANRPPTPAQDHAAGAAPSPAVHSPDA